MDFVEESSEHTGHNQDGCCFLTLMIFWTAVHPSAVKNCFISPKAIVSSIIEFDTLSGMRSTSFC